MMPVYRLYTTMGDNVERLVCRTTNLGVLNKKKYEWESQHFPTRTTIDEHETLPTT